MEGIQTARELIKPNNWLTRIDVQKAPKIPVIHGGPPCLPSHLPSIWTVECLGSKTVRPVAAKLRELGIRLVIYLDVLVITNSKEQVMDHTSMLIYVIENLGFVTHPEGGVSGMNIDTVLMELQVPCTKMKAPVKNMLKPDTFSAQEVTSLIGKMTSIAQGIPPVPLFYWTLQRMCLGHWHSATRTMMLPVRYHRRAQ